jgi:hypothetical protein
VDECHGKCDTGCKKDCDPGCKSNCDPGCKSKCDPPCKSASCKPKPPPPPKCDAQCQLNKKAQKERDDLEQDAKTISQPPPGDPVCANGNPALCPGDPTTPATVVTSGGDLTQETVDWSNQQYQTALDQYGSVISNVAATGGYNWFNGINGSQQCKSADCLGPGFGGPGAVGVPGAGGMAGAGAIAAGGAASGIGDAIAKIIDQILHNAAAGSDSSSGSSSSSAGSAAQSPGDGDCEPPRPCFRGGRGDEPPTFKPRPNDYRVDKTTGFVKDTHGVSVNVNAGKLTSKGFVPYEIDQSTIPRTLRMIQRGQDLEHYEIVPRPGANLTPEQFAEELAKIKVR